MGVWALDWVTSRNPVRGDRSGEMALKGLCGEGVGHTVLPLRVSAYPGDELLVSNEEPVYPRGELLVSNAATASAGAVQISRTGSEGSGDRLRSAARVGEIAQTTSAAAIGE